MEKPSNSIDWDHVGKWVGKTGTRANWRPYGLPEVLNPKRSAFADIPPMPAWKLSDKLFITAAITGAFFSKNANPHQPITPTEIRNAAAECIEAGASGVHIHVRDRNGLNALDPKLFHEVIAPLREVYPEAVIDGCLVAVSEEEDAAMQPMMRSGLLDGLPVNPTAICCGDNMLFKAPHVVIEKTRRTLDAGLIPQIAVYTDGDVDNARRFLVDTLLIPRPCSWLILPALPGCTPMHSPEAMADGLLRMVRLIREVDPKGIIAVCAAGRASTYLATMAVLMGLHVRVGMEDTIWKWPHREETLSSSAEHFRSVRDIALLLGREVMTPGEYRELLGLRQKTRPSAAAIGA
jgi:3-keto-5-aminohexanoate cleavage enzyme